MPILLTILALIIALVSPAFAVTRDTVSSDQKDATGTLLSQTHTVTSSGGNRALYLFCGLRSNTVTATATYNGDPMTEVTGASIAHGSSAIRAYTFRKTDPATGAHDWEVTQSSGIAMICYAVSVTNVNQAAPETDADEICGTTDPETRTLTTTNDDLLFDGFAMAILGSSTPGADQTEEIDLQEGSTTLTFAGSRQSGADGGVMSQDASGANNHCYVAVSIAHSEFSSRRSIKMELQ